MSRLFFLCLQVRLIGSSISTITSNKLEHNTVTSTKAITFWRIGHVHSCFEINNVLFKVHILNKKNCLKKQLLIFILLTSKSLTHYVVWSTWTRFTSPKLLFTPTIPIHYIGLTEIVYIIANLQWLHIGCSVSWTSSCVNILAKI